MPKNGRFLPQKADFCEIKKKMALYVSLTFDPKKLYTKFHQNPLSRFAVIVQTHGRTDRRTDAQTDGRTDRTDHIGPPKKFSGDK